MNRSEAATQSNSNVKTDKATPQFARKDPELDSSYLEKTVKERTKELETLTAELKNYPEGLEKTNEALRVIIQGVEEQKKETEKKLSQNLNLTVQPIMND